MELTGKAREKFYKWFYNKHFIFPETFITYPIEMQIGVYLDYFDYLGISNEIGVDYTMRGYTDERKYCFKLNGANWSDLYLSRNEARKEAIKKSNELYNKL